MKLRFAVRLFIHDDQICTEFRKISAISCSPTILPWSRPITELNRCLTTGIRWNKNEDVQTSPVVSANRLPNLLRNWIASVLIGPWDSTAIGTNSAFEERITWQYVPCFWSPNRRLVPRGERRGSGGWRESTMLSYLYQMSPLLSSLLLSSYHRHHYHCSRQLFTLLADLVRVHGLWGYYCLQIVVNNTFGKSSLKLCLLTTQIATNQVLNVSTTFTTRLTACWW